MTERILVVPPNLESAGTQFRRASGEFRSLVGHVNRQFLHLDWEGRDRDLMLDRISAVNRQADALTAEAERLAGYLLYQAGCYARLDAACSQRMPALAAMAVAATAAVSTGAAMAGAAAAAAVAATLGAVFGGAGTGPAITAVADYGRTMGAEPPQKPPAPPAPTGTALPTPEQLSYMQWVFGIDEAGYGPRTRAAVEHLQRRFGISPDSQMMIGPNTWAHLERFAKYRVHPVGEPSVVLSTPLGLAKDQTLTITSGWGDHPEGYIAGWSHWGMDFDVTREDPHKLPPVVAATSGTVLYAGLDPRTPSPGEKIGFGNVVVVQAHDGTLLVYAHMNEQPSVQPGEQIVAGHTLGIMGDTGMSEGKHLHLEVWRGISGEFTKGGAADWEAALRSTKPETFGNKNPLNYFDEATRAKMTGRS